MHPTFCCDINKKTQKKHLKPPSLSQLGRIKKTIFIIRLQSLLIIKKRGLNNRPLSRPFAYHKLGKETERDIRRVKSFKTNHKKKQRKGIKRSLSTPSTRASSSSGDWYLLEVAFVRAVDRERSTRKSRSFSFADRHQISPLRAKEGKNLRSKMTTTEMDQMKEKFSKLLLGEDMSGGGKGVSSALALSNAITNVAASVFGETSKLEPMPQERKDRWRKEVDWLLSVTDHIVEFVPAQQKSKDGTNMEVMVTRQRGDIIMHIPSLRELDNMLIDVLDDFEGEKEFWYVSSKDDASDAKNGTVQRNDDKWWVPTPRVPEGGLSETSRGWLVCEKESVNQVLKIAMKINAQILSEMEIPESYIESLPKNARSSLGEANYKSITMDSFSAEQFLTSRNLTTEHQVIDLKNKIEASIVIWKRKMTQKDSKSSWVSVEKREIFEERAEQILQLIKHRYPGLPQSSLDISKIQFNRDVGQAVLESYSRVIESLAYKLISRIKDVLYADTQAQEAALTNTEPNPEAEEAEAAQEKTPVAGEEPGTPSSVTLSDVMKWPSPQ